MSDSRSSRWWPVPLVLLVLIGAAVGVWALWFRGQERASLRAGGVRVVAVSPDGTLIAAAGETGAIRVWDVTTTGEKFTLEGHAGKVSGLAFSPDSKSLASCAEDHTIRLWDATAGKSGEVISSPEASADCVAFSLDGKAIASGGGDGHIRIWSVPGGKPVRTLKGHSKGVTALVFVPTGSVLASAAEDGTIRLTNWLTTDSLGQMSVEKHRVHSLAASADGKTLAGAVTGSGVRWWSLPDKTERPKVSGSGAARAVAFDREGKFLATVHEDGTVKLWSASDGAAVKTLKGHTGPVCGVGLTPDGHTVVSAGSDGTVKLWDVPVK